MSLAFKQRLQDRAQMFRMVRNFFEERNIMEVDTPILSNFAPIDKHIDVMEVKHQWGKGYLHTSPEYALKKLLSMGVGDIYQMSHVFRDGERGDYHHPEFTMIEWYRHHLTWEAFIDEVLTLLMLFIGPQKVEYFTYRELFLTYLELDPFSSLQQLKDFAPLADPEWDRETLLSYLMCECIEPNLKKKSLTIVTGFPASQAALSKISAEGFAMRFEVYFQGVELANGYDELIDPKEQEMRLERENAARDKKGKGKLPIDRDFLLALEKGMPECLGVAVGFDRLMQLRHNSCPIEEILPLLCF